MAVDIKRAYFYAPATRPIYIVIPDEDWEPGDEAKVGKLNLSLYGTRDAAANWVMAYTKVLKEAGFTVGKYSAQHFHHEQRDLAVSVHGDDFTCSGPEHALEWLKTIFEKAYEIKAEVLGPRADKGQKTEIRVLNRVLTWNSWGIGYEADPRHAEIVIRELGLSEGKSVTTPGSKDENAKVYTENGEDVTTLDEQGLYAVTQAKVRERETEKAVAGDELQGAEATLYRALCARLNYLAQDRPDIRYSCKEASRWMSCPRSGHWLILKRIARYLKGSPRLVQRLVWQQPCKVATTFVDSDWAGCKTTCRSTSGGAVMLGSHTVIAWSQTQGVVALSSGEAELYALTKGAANTLGVLSLAMDFGMSLDARIYSDASAAIGMVNRTGAGKLRHVRVQYLWLQDKVRTGELKVAKVAGEDNPADLLTKHVNAATLRKHTWELGFEVLQDRAATAPSLNALLGLLDGTTTFEWSKGLNGDTTRVLDRSEDAKQGDRQQDAWSREGVFATRIHTRSRKELFTPLHVSGSPQAKVLSPTRITEGKFADGREFKLVDSWRAQKAHQELEQPWTGCTRFILRGNAW